MFHGVHKLRVCQIVKTNGQTVVKVVPDFPDGCTCPSNSSGKH